MKRRIGGRIWRRLAPGRAAGEFNMEYRGAACVGRGGRSWMMPNVLLATRFAAKLTSAVELRTLLRACQPERSKIAQHHRAPCTARAALSRNRKDVTRR